MPGSCLSLSPVEEGDALGEEGWSHESDTQPPVAVCYVPGCPSGTSQQRYYEKFGLISMGPFTLPFAVPLGLSTLAMSSATCCLPALALTLTWETADAPPVLCGYCYHMPHHFCC